MAAYYRRHLIIILPLINEILITVGYVKRDIIIISNILPQLDVLRYVVN